jgi:hypothetical protein
VGTIENGEVFFFHISDMKFALIPFNFLPLWWYHCDTFHMTSVEDNKEELCSVMEILWSESVRVAGIYGILTVHCRDKCMRQMGVYK